MVTTLNFKAIIDLPKWRPLASTPPMSALTVATGMPLPDFRNNEDRHPFVFIMNINTANGYNVKTDGWSAMYPNLTSNSGAQGGSTMPSQGPRGTLAAGATTTSITLTTVLPAAVAVNALADRGDGRGFKIRIIGNAAGSSGLTEERLIVGNTAGTTPTIDLDSPLSFTPILGDGYQFLSGKIYTFGGTTSLRSVDLATGFVDLALAVLPLTTSTDSVFVPLDELYVPYNRNPGEGFLGILTATASGAASLTGQAVGGDAGVLADEYRNFQIRIIQDVAIPTAVGQRRNITTHTAGPSPVYTVPAWAVTPSATATYVIENNSDRFIYWTTSSLNTYTYTISTNTWDTNATFAVRPTILGSGGVVMQSFGIVPDVAKNSRHSFIFGFRGGGNYRIVDLFDIAGAATGTWTTAITIGNPSQFNWTFTNGTGFTYDPATNQGRYLYIWPNAGVISSPTIGTSVGQEFFRFDLQNRVWENFTYRKFPQGAGILAGNKLSYTVYIDGDTKLGFIMHYVKVRSGAAAYEGGNLPFFGCPITI